MLRILESVIKGKHFNFHGSSLFRYGVGWFTNVLFKFLSQHCRPTQKRSLLSLLPDSHAGALVLDPSRSPSLFSEPLFWGPKSPSVDKTWSRQKRWCYLGNAAVDIASWLELNAFSRLVGRTDGWDIGEEFWSGERTDPEKFWGPRESVGVVVRWEEPMAAFIWVILWHLCHGGLGVPASALFVCLMSASWREMKPVSLPPLSFPPRGSDWTGSL